VHRQHNWDPLEARVGAGAAALALERGEWAVGEASGVVERVRALGAALW